MLTLLITLLVGRMNIVFYKSKVGQRWFSDTIHLITLAAAIRELQAAIDICSILLSLSKTVMRRKFYPLNK